MIKWCSKKTVNRKKIVDMKLRSGRKTFSNSSFTGEIQIPNKTSKQSKKNKKAEGNAALNKLPACNKQHKSKQRTSNPYQGSLFSRNEKSMSMTSILNHTVISHPTEVTNLSSTSLDFPLGLTQSVIPDSREARHQSSASLNLPVTSTPNMSVISGSCAVRNQPTTSKHILVAGSTSNGVTDQLSEAFKSVSIKNLSSDNQCTLNSANTNNFSEVNYYSLVSDRSLSSYIDSAVTTMPINSSVEESRPLIVDVSNVRKKSKMKKFSILESIIKQDQGNGEKDKATQDRGQKRKHGVSVQSVLSSMEKRKDGHNEKHNDDDDVCSVVSVSSDEDIMILENKVAPNLQSKEQLPPRKRQKKMSEITINLVTPDVSSSKSKKKSRRITPSKPLQKYVSVLGNFAQRGPLTFTKEIASIRNPPGVPSSSMCDGNLYNPNPVEQKGLRPIAIDGNNVAFGYSNGAYFSCKGLKICVDFFLKRNHRVTAFVPKFRKHHAATKDPEILDDLEKRGLVSFTPSFKIDGKLVVPYDDRFIIQYAAACGGVIVSQDNYRDLVRENPAWKDTIMKRLLRFMWAPGDILIFPQDPLGRNGPRLEEFLSFPNL